MASKVIGDSWAILSDIDTKDHLFAPFFCINPVYAGFFCCTKKKRRYKNGVIGEDGEG